MKKLLAMLLAIATALCAGCARQTPKKSSERFAAMDTVMSVDVYGDSDAMRDVKEEILRLDKLLSAAEPESDVSRVNASGAATVDEAVAELAAKSLEICRDTGGALDVTILPVVEEWGFISKNYRVPGDETLAALLKNVDYSAVSVSGGSISLPKGARLDFGAVAKGYAADRAKQILDKSSSDSALLNLGGTVLAYGKKNGSQQWKVGVADPDNSATYMGMLNCEDVVVATSGSYERYFEGSDGKIYSHIIDPKTGKPVDNGILSVTVVCRDGTLCDALSTALFVMGKEKAEQYCKSKNSFDYIMLTADKKAYVTKGVADSFTLADGYDYEVVNVMDN